MGELEEELLLLSELVNIEIGRREKRALCQRCGRPQGVCWCVSLCSKRLDIKSRVLLLQHPNEEKRCLRTAPILSASLPYGHYIELKGKRFPLSRYPELARVLQSPHTILMYPGEGAVGLEELPPVGYGQDPYNILILDGTWHQAKSIYHNCPSLHHVKQVCLSGRYISEYIIRTQPTEDALSTVETVAITLATLEQDWAIYDTLVQPLRTLCEYQIQHGAVPHQSKEQLILSGRCRKPLGKRTYKKLKKCGARQYQTLASVVLGAMQGAGEGAGKVVGSLVGSGTAGEEAGKVVGSLVGSGTAGEAAGMAVGSLEGAGKALEGLVGSGKAVGCLEGAGKAVDCSEEAGKVVDNLVGSRTAFEMAGGVLESLEGAGRVSESLEGAGKAVGCLEGAGKAVDCSEECGRVLERSVGSGTAVEGARRVIDSLEESGKVLESLEGTGTAGEGIRGVLEDSQEAEKVLDCLEGSGRVVGSLERSGKALSGLEGSGTAGGGAGVVLESSEWHRRLDEEEEDGGEEKRKEEVKEPKEEEEEEYIKIKRNFSSHVNYEVR